MRITPLDVRKQEFRKAVRGFDCDEVRAFLTTLADEYETVLVDNKQIRETIMDQDEKIAEYKAMERTLRDTLMTAERLMQETRENANREGDLIVQEAQINARKILEECRLRTEELRREIMGLRKEKETYLGRFKGLAEAQIQFIEAHQNDFEDLDKRLVDLVDSVVTGAVERIDSRTPGQSRPESNPGQLDASVESTIDTTIEAVRSAATEEDIWRDYSTGSESPPASDRVQTEDIVDKTVEAVTATAQPITDATVELAAMGIPVPAVDGPIESVSEDAEIGADSQETVQN